jgi:DNA primase
LFKKRLVIPFVYDGEIVGWSGRHINPPNKRTPKYLNENLPPDFVFNVDPQLDPHRKIVIVNEGYVDAIVTGGVAFLSQELSDAQARQISNLADRVILCPDRDRDGAHSVETAIQHGWDVTFPPWARGIKDAGSAAQRYGRLATVASIIQYAEHNKIKIKAQAKLYLKE